MPTNATASIRQWMDKTLQLQSKNGLSQEYIAAALQIAISLTEQVKKSCSEDSGLPPPYPMSRIDWTDSIEVSFEKRDYLERSREELLSTNASAPSDLQNEKGDGGADEGTLSIPPHLNLNVAGAKIVYNGQINESYLSNNPNDELQKIYSLGLVFYQVFSPGQVPSASELLVVSSPDGECTPFSSCPGSIQMEGVHI